jgi:predicted nucleic acid-binding protein
LILFLDTSALVKLYIADTGSERMRQAASRGEPVAASDLAFAETHATFARRGREELLRATETEEIRTVFGEDWERLTQIPLSATVLKLVPGLCQRHPLRGADAVHLASALLLHEEGIEVIFACSDHRLLEAAAAEGLTTFDPAAEEQV